MFDNGQIAFAKLQFDAPTDIGWKTGFGIICRIELDAPSRAAFYDIDLVTFTVRIERLSSEVLLCVGNSDLLRSRCWRGATYERQRCGENVKLPHGPIVSRKRTTAIGREPTGRFNPTSIAGGNGKSGG